MLEQITLDEIVIESAREVFETMVFLEIETRDDARPATSEHSLLGSITFKGCIEGCLTICVSLRCAERIAANMLGLEPEQQLSTGEICDAIGEVANMVMGSIKTRLLKDYRTIEVSIPSVIAGQELRNTRGENVVATTVCAWLDEEDAVEISLLYREVQR